MVGGARIRAERVPNLTGDLESALLLSDTSSDSDEGSSAYPDSDHSCSSRGKSPGIPNESGDAEDIGFARVTTRAKVVAALGAVALTVVLLTVSLLGSTVQPDRERGTSALLQSRSSAEEWQPDEEGEAWSAGPLYDWFEFPSTPCGNLMNRCDPDLPKVPDGGVCLKSTAFRSSLRAACCANPTSECVGIFKDGGEARCMSSENTELVNRTARGFVGYGEMRFTMPRPQREDREDERRAYQSSLGTTLLTLEDIVDTVFVITMPQRRSAVENFLNQLELKRGVIVEAILADTLPPLKELQRAGIACSEGKVECSFEGSTPSEEHLRVLSSVHLSHGKAIQAVADLGGDRWGLIFEDDVAVPPSGVARRVKEFMDAAPADMDMGLLSFCYEDFDPGRVVAGPPGLPNVYASKQPLCGTSYILTARAAQRLLDRPNTHPISDWHWIRNPVNSGAVRAYSPLCPLFQQKPESLSGHDNGRYPSWSRGLSSGSGRSKSWRNHGMWFLGKDPGLREAKLRRQPTKFILGSPKSGTSSLFLEMKSWPNFRGPTGWGVYLDKPWNGKEVHFFSFNEMAAPGGLKAYINGLKMLRNFFPPARQLTDTVHFLDSTPNYFGDAAAAARIAAAYGGASSTAARALRFVVALRDPVTRTASKWAHFVTAGYMKSNHGDFVNDAADWLAESQKCTYHATAPPPKNSRVTGELSRLGCNSVLGSSLYELHFRRWLDVGFHSDQFCVVFTNELFPATYSRTMERLRRCMGAAAGEESDSSYIIANNAANQPWAAARENIAKEDGRKVVVTKGLGGLYRPWNCALGDFLASHPGFGMGREQVVAASGGWVPSAAACASETAIAQASADLAAAASPDGFGAVGFD